MVKVIIDIAQKFFKRKIKKRKKEHANYVRNIFFWKNGIKRGPFERWVMCLCRKFLKKI